MCLCHEGFSSVSVSAQDGIVVLGKAHTIVLGKAHTILLGKAHTHSALSLSSLPKVALETVPMFVWLNIACVTTFTSIVRLEVITVDTPVFVYSPSVLTVKPQPDRSLVTTASLALCLRRPH